MPRSHPDRARDGRQPFSDPRSSAVEFNGLSKIDCGYEASLCKISGGH